MKTRNAKKVLKTLSIAGLFFAQNNLALAEELPKDLEKITSYWSTVEKTSDATSLVSVSAGSVESEETFRSGLMEELKSQIDPSKSYTGISYQDLTEDVRGSMLDALFPTEEMPLFCKAIPSQPIKLRADKPLTPEEIQAKQKTADHTRCKKVFKELLSGIVHADPKSHLLSVTEANGTQKLSLWFFSMMNDKAYIRVDLTK